MTDPSREWTLWKRFGWFVLLWVGGVSAVMILAWVVRAVIPVS